MNSDSCRPSRIVQVLPSFHERDAIGNHAANIRRLLEERGFVSGLYLELFYGTAGTEPLDALAAVAAPDTMIIYHYSTGSEIPKRFLDIPGFKVVCYHNITPAYYFADSAEGIIRGACQMGRLQMGLVQQTTDFVWADSAYNASELVCRGFPEGLVLPILRDYSALTHLEPDDKLARLLADSGRQNWLFVGRIVPNKAAHDLIMTLDLYQKATGRKCRLLLPGSELPSYGKKLRTLCTDLGLKFADGYSGAAAGEADVLFLGSISTRALATCYRSAQLFLSLSDHEGFCVPLLEAMAFGLPVVAHRSSVIPETAGGAALLVDKRDPVQLLQALNQVLNTNERDVWISKSRLRIKDFAWEQLIARFDECLNQALAAFAKKHSSVWQKLPAAAPVASLTH